MAWETLSMDSRKRKKDKIMRNIAATAEMIDITMVATTRHLFPVCAPPMARPPEMKKRTEVQIPVPREDGIE